jgi:hypothetical protein
MVFFFKQTFLNALPARLPFLFRKKSFLCLVILFYKITVFQFGRKRKFLTVIAFYQGTLIEGEGLVQLPPCQGDLFC